MERISVTVSLNGVAIPFEQAAYERLEAYLADARRALAGNPDRPEILADLEQAIAEQCRRRTRIDQAQVTRGELDPALEEIGPVQEPETIQPPLSAATPRLEQISEGALISGVCQGLARYFRVDVTLVRVIALLLLLLSGGIVILVYAGMMLLVPYAPRSPAGGPIGRIPSKCRDFVGALRSRLGVVGG